MADYQPTQQQRPYDADKGPSATQVVAVVTLLPVGGTLLLLAGLTLAITVVGLAISAPLFVIFSPALVPAALVIGLAVTGFLTSGAFGITALSALSWLANHVRRMRGAPPEPMRYAAAYLGQRTNETGQTIFSKAQEGGKAQ